MNEPTYVTILQQEILELESKVSACFKTQQLINKQLIDHIEELQQQIRKLNGKTE